MGHAQHRKDSPVTTAASRLVRWPAKTIRGGRSQSCPAHHPTAGWLIEPTSRDAAQAGWDHRNYILSIKTTFQLIPPPPDITSGLIGFDPECFSLDLLRRTTEEPLSHDVNSTYIPTPPHTHQITHPILPLTSHLAAPPTTTTSSSPQDL